MVITKVRLTGVPGPAFRIVANWYRGYHRTSNILMARFLNVIGDGATPGERRFGERLRSHLEDDYLCWFNVPVGPQRQYPDYVVLHPGRGIWIFEIKDWNLDSIRAITKTDLELISPTGALKTVANPIYQARQYCMTVVNKLSMDPQLQDPSARYRGKICFPYAYAAVLTNISRRELDEVLTPDEQELVLPARLVICKDEMTPSVEAGQFQERLWGMFHYQFGNPLSLPQIERVRWHLFPEIRIAPTQKDFFNSDPAPDTEEVVPEIIRVMDLAQEQLARSLGQGHRVIHGVAGSGKTLILGYRCLHLARELSKPILVLCYNITLAARLRSFIAGKGIGDKVQVYHFHDWCKVQLTTYHVDLLPTNKQPWERQVESVIHGVANGHIPRAQYGAIMIDEGHDFEPEWLKLIAQMTDPDTDSLLLLYDDAQAIYQKKSALKFTLSSVGIKAQGRTTILRLNYRNTREILSLAYDFAASFLKPTDADDDHIPLIRPEAAGISGSRPVIRRHQSLKEEIDFAARCVQKWQSEGLPLHDMAIVCIHKPHGPMMAEALEKHGIPTHWTGSRSGKTRYDPGSEKVTILPVPSSKGLEFHTVIILGVGHAEGRNQTEVDAARLLYVGMTRAREKLLMTFSSDNAFTERLMDLAA